MMICIIPARGGSTRVPKKNIKPLAGRPLILYTIDQAIDSNVFDTIIIDTDSNEIIETVEKNRYGHCVCYHKRNEITNSYKSVQESVIDCINDISTLYQFDSICVMMPVCPIRSVLDIQNMYYEFHKNNYKSLLTCTKYEKPLEWSMTIDYQINNLIYFPDIHCTDLTCRSQDCKCAVYPVGSIWMIDKQTFLDYKTVYVPGFRAYLINKMYGLDIDTIEDFDIAELIIRGLDHVE